MKKVLVAIVTGSLLALSAPAQADTVTKIVNGFDYPSGLGFTSEFCSGGATGATALYRKGGLRGTHSTGVSFGGATRKEGGVQAKVTTPRSLTSISMATYHPQGPDADNLADGHFVALYDPSGDNFNDGYYFAKYGLDASITGWGTWSNFANASLTWSYWDGASTTPVAGQPSTIKQFADSFGTNGSGAWVGFEFGCNGRDYYMDDFRVATSSRTTIYDFEGVLSRSYLSTPPNHHSMTAKRDVTKLKLVQNQRHWILGDAAGYSDGVLDAAWTAGDASLYAKPYGASAYRKVDTGQYSSTTWAQFKIKAKKRTQYQIRTAATGTYESDVSKTLVVSVVRRIKAKLADNVVRRGNAMKVTGELFPGDRGVRVTLQRKSGAKWKSLAKAKSRAGGKYTIKAKATVVGKSKLRVVVGNAKGNLGNKSPAMKITVKKPPPTPAPDPQTPETVENPVPPEMEAPSDEIKARALVRQLLRQLFLPTSVPVPPHQASGKAGPVVVEPGVSQRRG